jgi:hypothetical protein
MFGIGFDLIRGINADTRAIFRRGNITYCMQKQNNDKLIIYTESACKPIYSSIPFIYTCKLYMGPHFLIKITFSSFVSSIVALFILTTYKRKRIQKSK